MRFEDWLKQRDPILFEQIQINEANLWAYAKNLAKKLDIYYGSTKFTKAAETYDDIVGLLQYFGRIARTIGLSAAVTFGGSDMSQQNGSRGVDNQPSMTRIEHPSKAKNAATEFLRKTITGDEEDPQQQNYDDKEEEIKNSEDWRAERSKAAVQTGKIPAMMQTTNSPVDPLSQWPALFAPYMPPQTGPPETRHKVVKEPPYENPELVYQRSQFQKRRM